LGYGEHCYPRKIYQCDSPTRQNRKNVFRPNPAYSTRSLCLDIETEVGPRLNIGISTYSNRPSLPLLHSRLLGRPFNSNIHPRRISAWPHPKVSNIGTSNGACSTASSPAACCRCLHTNSVTAFIDRIYPIFSFLKEPETNDRPSEQTSAFLDLCGVTVASRGSSCVMIVCSLDRAEGRRRFWPGAFSAFTTIVLSSLYFLILTLNLCPDRFFLLFYFLN